MVRRATLDEAPVVRTLVEQYADELSAIFHVERGPDGRVVYEALPRYWTEPEQRFPFLIICGQAVAGFALATRGSPATDDPADLDVAEFFVLREHRRGGVGRRAAIALWDVLPGQWVVRVAAANEAGLAFWADVIAGYTAGTFVERRRPGPSHDWRVFVFRSRQAAPGRAAL